MVEGAGVFPASIVCPQGGFGNPYGIEGFKTIAFEIFDQLGRRMGSTGSTKGFQNCASWG